MEYPLKKLFVLHSTFQSAVQNLKFVPRGEKQREVCAFVSVCDSGSQAVVCVPLGFVKSFCVWFRPGLVLAHWCCRSCVFRSFSDPGAVLDLKSNVALGLFILILMKVYTQQKYAHFRFCFHFLKSSNI